MKKLYKTILGLVLATSANFSANAQVSAYAFNQSSTSYSAISSGTVLATATGTNAAGTIDDAVYNLPTGTFPFSFIYNNIAYTGCNASSNGFITFGTTAPGLTNYTPISGAALFAGSISAWGGDLNSMFSAGTSSLTGELRYDIIGLAPNREVVFQYTNWRPSYATSTTNIFGMNFQIRLQETSNKISIVYGSNAYVVGSTNITGTRQIGLRGAGNTDFNCRSNSGTVLFTSSTNGLTNAATQTYSTTGTTPGMPVSGLMYEWTPPTPCSGTPNAGTAISSLTSVCTATNINLNLSGSTSGVTGLTYQWFSSPDGSAWSPISSATTIATTQSVSSTTYFQCVVSCGSNTTASTPVQIQIATTTTNTVPYFEGFESTVVGQLPNCSWAKTGDWTTNTGTQTNNRFPRTGTKYAHTSWSTIVGGDYIYSNGIQLTAGVSYSANAFYVVDGAAGWDEVSMLYGTSQSTTGLVNIASQFSLTNMSYMPINGTFSVGVSGIYYLAFKAIAPTTTPWYLSIDDISLELAPSCVTPPALGSISGTTSLNIGSSASFSVSALTGNIQWYQGASATGPWNVISTATTNPANITFNTAGTVFLSAIASNPGCLNDTTNSSYQITVLFPGNDVCDAIALSIGASTVKYSLYGANSQAGEVTPPGTGCSTNNSWCAANTLHNTRWFSFVAPASGNVTVQSPGFDTQLAVWKTSSCANLIGHATPTAPATATLIAANDDDANYTTHSGVNFSSYVTAGCLTPGATYFIQLDSYDPALITDSTLVLVMDAGMFTAVATSTDATCGTCADGTGDVTATGGVAPFTYLWSDAFASTSSTVYSLTPGCYTVTITDAFACQASQTVCVGFATGIKSLTKTAGISIFPNPTNGLVTIEVVQTLVHATIEVYDAVGKLAIKELLTKNNSTLDFSKLQEGIYIYKIINDKSVVKTGKLIKQ